MSLHHLGKRREWCSLEGWRPLIILQIINMMNSQDLTFSSPEAALDVKETEDSVGTVSHTPNDEPPRRSRLLKRLSPFWQDRLIEVGLIVSMASYYVIGNQHLGSGRFFHLNPLYTLPFLLIFAVLCWYRLSFAVALLPLTLPYYLLPKTVVGSYAFSMAEITLIVCLGVALVQLLFLRRTWQYWLSWQELRDRLGPFVIPILVFLAAAVLSTVIAYNHQLALRAFRKEMLDPMLY